MSLSEGRMLRDDGCKKAIASKLEWARKATILVIHIAKKKGWVTADCIRTKLGPPPTNGTLGAVFSRLSHDNVIKKKGNKQSASRTRHAGEIKIWQLVR